MTSTDWQAAASLVQAATALGVLVLTGVLAWVNVRTLGQVREQAAATRAQWQLSELPMVVPVDVKRSPDRWEVAFQNVADKPVLAVRFRAGNEPEPAVGAGSSGSMMLPRQSSTVVRNDERVGLSLGAFSIPVQVTYRTIRGLEVRASWLCVPAIEGLTSSPGFFLERLEPEASRT